MFKCFRRKKIPFFLVGGFSHTLSWDRAKSLNNHTRIDLDFFYNHTRSDLAQSFNYKLGSMIETRVKVVQQ